MFAYSCCVLEKRLLTVSWLPATRRRSIRHSFRLPTLVENQVLATALPFRSQPSSITCLEEVTSMLVPYPTCLGIRHQDWRKVRQHRGKCQSSMAPSAWYLRRSPNNANQPTLDYHFTLPHFHSSAIPDAQNTFAFSTAILVIFVISSTPYCLCNDRSLPSTQQSLDQPSSTLLFNSILLDSLFQSGLNNGVPRPVLHLHKWWHQSHQS
ncbi:hypothetical protein B0T10DRAFT_239245 [Thelonectria olida]|uniref:Uncharacterized protein n=1 Tax=Thelonectria olida TaxID=1576542 RepID=A0A9P8WAA5_9HYPO|nr:hypothetical protein B0T10DRAFT_239245 [Thelonectria olida]